MQHDANSWLQRKSHFLFFIFLYRRHEKSPFPHTQRSPNVFLQSRKHQCALILCSILTSLNSKLVESMKALEGSSFLHYPDNSLLIVRLLYDVWMQQVISTLVDNEQILWADETPEKGPAVGDFTSMPVSCDYEGRKCRLDQRKSYLCLVATPNLETARSVVFLDVPTFCVFIWVSNT